MPDDIRKLYDERDRLEAIIYDDWSTEDAKRAAVREKMRVDDALANREA